MADTYLVPPGTFIVADIIDGPKNRVLAGPDEDGDYIDSINGDVYYRKDVTHIRPAAVLTVPRITGTQPMGPLTMYTTSIGTTFKPNNLESYDKYIETAAAAIAVKKYQEDADPTTKLKRQLGQFIERGSYQTGPELRELLRQAQGAGLLKI